jgi:hypothetical protein
MGFFKDMGFFEKVAFCVCAPVLLPVAAAVTAYEAATRNEVFSDTKSPSTGNEQEIRARSEQRAKEQRAEEERNAIIVYAKNGLATLQISHSITGRPVTALLTLEQLREASQSSERAIDILGRWLPQAPKSDVVTKAHLEITRLTEEINELRQLRQSIIDLQHEENNT